MIRSLCLTLLISLILPIGVSLADEVPFAGPVTTQKDEKPEKDRQIIEAKSKKDNLFEKSCTI